MRSRRLLTLAFVLALAAWPTTASAGITEYTGALTAASAPTDITTGADGNLWFTEQGLVGGIGRITPSGAITE